MNGQSYHPEMWDAALAHEARTELNDAIDRDNETALAKWARKWGHGMLEECGTGGDSDKIDDLREEIRGLEVDLKKSEEEVEELTTDVERLNKENDKLTEQVTALEADRVSA